MELCYKVRMRRWILLAVLATVAAPPSVFGQPNPSAVTLRETLALARAQSPARQAAAARAEAADLSQTWAGRMLNPTTEFRWENIAPGLRTALPADVFATLTQPIELGGKRGARRGVAAAVATAARANLGATERALEVEVARRYVAAVRGRDRRDTLTVQAAGLSELVRILERRVAEGVTADADLRKLETERARVDIDAALARIAAQRELVGLAALAGWSSPPSLEALERPAVELPPNASADAVVMDAVDRRDDVRVAVSRVGASQHALRLEESRRVPDLHVTGGFKRTAGYDTGLVALLVPVPLFERNRASIVLAHGNVKAAELELAQTRRLAAGEARAAVGAAIDLTRRANDAAARLIEPATIARAAARAAFTSGAGDLLRLVDAERVYADARLTVDDLANAALLATIEARFALAEEAIP